MRFGCGIVGDPAVTALGCNFMLGTAVIGINRSAVIMGTGFCEAAVFTGIAVENVVIPSGIAPSFQLLAAGFALGVITVHIAVFVGIDGLRVGVGTFFLIPADRTFVTAVEAVVIPSGISPAFGDGTTFRTLGLATMHFLVFDGVHLRIAVGTGGKHRHRQDGHNHQYGEKRTQKFRKIL